MKPIKPQSQMSERERAFWDKYAGFILSKNVSGRAGEASIRHAQQFAYNLGGIKLRNVDKTYLIGYFDELGRCNNIVAWRFRQAVSAIEMLFEMLAVNPVIREFNWEECREAARELGRSIRRWPGQFLRQKRWNDDHKGMVL